MSQLIGDFLLVLSAIFVVVDPLPVAPMFAAMTAHRSRAEVRAIARRATLAAAGLLTFFALFGGVPSRSLVFSWVHFAPPAA